MIPTPHINAKKEDFAETVIMPGDPLRSKFIADNFLENTVLINNVRGVQGYTGYYKGKKVSVMASGMGNPSMGIYSYELFTFYDVQKIIRVGSIGALKKEIKLKDILIISKSFTETNYDGFYRKNGMNFIEGNEELSKQAVQIAKELNMKYHLGNVLCSDTFYTDEDQAKIALENDLIGAEMESASLYINAKKTGKKALAICTVSDNIITGENTSSEERQTAFSDMIKIALEMV